jgi:hypothetical protein
MTGVRAAGAGGAGVGVAVGAAEIIGAGVEEGTTLGKAVLTSSMNSDERSEDRADGLEASARGIIPT